MDLHVIGPLASPAERAAVDAVLGPPESGWVGGPRDSAIDGHASRGGHAVRARRSQLLPALHAVQSRVGWISQPALNYISKRLAVPPAEAYGVATFYALYSVKPRPPVVAHVCDDIACRLAGAERICDDLTRAVGPAGEATRDGRTGWLRSPCLGPCDLGSCRDDHDRGRGTEVGDRRPGRRRRDRRATRDRGRHDPARTRPSADRRSRRSAPRPHRRRRPGSFDDYRSHGGYAGLTRAIEIGSGGRHRGGDGLEAHGPRWRRVPDGSQVGRGGGPGRRRQVRHLQRRRVRTRAPSRTACSSKATRSRSSRR